MKRLIILTAFFTLSLSLSVLATEPSPDKSHEDALMNFLENTYEVVGRYPDGGATYCGTVTLARKENELVMTREIKGKKIVGTARLVLATADSAAVLRAEFVEGKQKYQATYVIGSDLDNYARLSGWVYHASRETKKPGMEALFIVLAPPEK